MEVKLIPLAQLNQQVEELNVIADYINDLQNTYTAISKADEVSGEISINGITITAATEDILELLQKEIDRRVQMMLPMCKALNVDFESIM